MGSRSGLAGRNSSNEGKLMAKVKNAGAADYTGIVEVRAGEVAEVTDEQAKYLLSDECPGEFVAVAEEAKKPAGKK